MDRPTLRALQSTLDRWQLFSPCLGANVTIEDSLRGNWTGASGYADVETKTPMPLGAKFYIYSITKSFTAVRVLQLAEQSLVSLDDPITSYLPELAFPPEVTLRRLLNHTSGVPNYTDLPEYAPATRESPSRPWSYEHVLDLTCSGKLDFPPGEGWHYSNTGYMLLARVIESVTQASFARNIDEGIVERLGLQCTSVAEDVDTGLLTPSYCRSLSKDEMVENIAPRYHPGWCKTGLIISTTDEVAKFYRCLFNGSVIYPQSLAHMKSWVSVSGNAGTFFKKPAYGLGLMIDPDWGFGGLFAHGGGGPGCRTWAMHLPDFYGRSLTLAILCNTSMTEHPFDLTKDLLGVMKDE